MGLAFRVKMPRGSRPVFPDRCVQCGREHPENMATLIGRNALAWRNLLGGWANASVPCCKGCAWRLHIGRLWRSARTVLIVGAILAAAQALFHVLDKPSDAKMLGTFGAIVLGIVLDVIHNFVRPLPFNIEVGPDNIEFQFRDHAQGGQFARSNGAR